MTGFDFTKTGPSARPLAARSAPDAIGLPGEVEIPTMKSLLIEVRRGEMTLGKATGTLVARDKASRVVLITNRHVVTGRRQDDDQPLDRNGAIPDNLLVHFHEGDERAQMAAGRTSALPGRGRVHLDRAPKTVRER